MHEKMPTDTGMVSHDKPAAPKGTWLGLVADDVSSKTPLSTDGMSAERPGPAYDKVRAWQPSSTAP